MKAEYDLAIVGSGFAGSLLATIGRKLGLSVSLLESGRHPRFAIGESSTPLANLLLEELTTRYDLPHIAPLAKWGSWQDAYPGLPCGLKRGFSFFHHSLGERLKTNAHHDNQLLVAASPHDRIADVHWYRAELDHFLVRAAQEGGVDFLDEVRLESACETREGMELKGVRKGESVSIRASFVADASGPRGFLHKALRLTEAELPFLPKTQALYSHFTGVRPFASCSGADFSNAPYPVDEAAVHHVFEGGWIWILRFNNGVTSAGVAAVEGVAERFQFHEGAPAWTRLLAKLPSVQDQFADSKTERPFVHMPQVAFRSGRVTGERWALLPSAAGFVDPLLSTGFPLALLGVKRLANVLQTSFGSPESEALLKAYSEQTQAELVASSRLIAALYRGMNCFPLFSSLSLLYFASASYAETARRLGKTELAASFLLHDHPVFGPASRNLLDSILKTDADLSCDRMQQRFLSTIDRINIAGLGNPSRCNWYPVEAEDLLEAAGKLESNRDEIQLMLRRSGFWQQSV